MTLGWRGWLATASALLGGLSATSASAQASAAVEAGTTAYLSAEFEAAVTHLESALASPDATTADLATAHAYLSALRTILGDAEAGRRHAQLAVALDPAARPPEGVPPEVETAFAEARARFAEARPAVRVESQGELTRGGSVTVRAALEPDPSLAARLALACASGSEVREEGEPSGVELTLELGNDRASCEARALSEGGATLFRGSWEGRAGGAGQTEGGGDDGAIIGAVVGGGVGLVAVVVIIVLAAVLSEPPSEQVQLGAPTVIGW
ncbi:MAG: hypothetical protein AB7S26_28240 [Sandaracinaceae bacterium]